MPNQKSTLMGKARKWSNANGLHGPQAFLRYVMFRFVEQINTVTDDFIFKGGNLLWVYIKTPRATVDLDFSTLKSMTHPKVKLLLNKACLFSNNELLFMVTKFEEVNFNNTHGAAVTVQYEASTGAKNKFDIDIVYAIPADFLEISSPVDNVTNVRAASIENIICDKLQAVQRFGSGNTRLKDYDDLWRLSQSSVKIRADKLSSLLTEKGILPTVDKEWVHAELERMWKNYRARYNDLPSDLLELFISVNRWLVSILK